MAELYEIYGISAIAAYKDYTDKFFQIGVGKSDFTLVGAKKLLDAAVYWAATAESNET